MKGSKIEWTDHTYNPWEGCTKVSPGCEHCYAETLVDTRYGRTTWGNKGKRRRVTTSVKDPLKWQKSVVKTGKRASVFCASLCDFFDTHPSIEQEWRDETWKMIRQTPLLTWLLLTKRPGNIKKMLPDDWGTGYENVCLMVSAEDQKRAEQRIPALLDVPATYYGLSVEPLLDEVDLSPWIDRISWVIVGGESGHGARPMNPEWVRNIRDLCLDHGVPFLFKQWGFWTPEEIPKAKTTHDFPDGQRVYYRAKTKKNGNFLDGEQHLDDPFPKRATKEEREMVVPLTAKERKALTSHLRTIEKGFDTFVDVGMALKAIREDRLYREEYSSWDAFCQDMFGRTKTHANRQIQAADVVIEMREMTPIGVKSDTTLPTRESHARELVRIKEPAQRLEVWEEVVKRSDGKTITVPAIETVIEEKGLSRKPAKKAATKTTAAETRQKVRDLLDEAVQKKNWGLVKKALQLLDPQSASK